MLGRVGLARTDVSEEHIASIFRVTRISEIRKTLAVTTKYYILNEPILSLCLIKHSAIETERT
jgi:hypothetical protein